MEDDRDSLSPLSLHSIHLNLSTINFASHVDPLQHAQAAWKVSDLCGRNYAHGRQHMRQLRSRIQWTSSDRIVRLRQRLYSWGTQAPWLMAAVRSQTICHCFHVSRSVYVHCNDEWVLCSDGVANCACARTTMRRNARHRRRLSSSPSQSLASPSATTSNHLENLPPQSTQPHKCRSKAISLNSQRRGRWLLYIFASPRTSYPVFIVTPPL